MKAIHFVANIEGKVKSYFGVNAAATGAAGEYSGGKW